MARFNIVENGDPVLRKTARPVQKVDEKVVTLIRNMAETMYHANGVGLAAPQVGISKRVIVVDIGEGLYALINPEIIAKDGIQDGPEGCLSVPGMTGEVMRSNHITVKALNEKGEPVILDAEGFFARAIQHEIDHLNGILFIDKAKHLERM